MTAVSNCWSIAGAALLALGATPAAAQAVTYKCVVHGAVTYSQVPCPGGRVMATLSARSSERWREPPQDRAVLARRAQLTEEDRQQCRALDGELAREQHLLKTRGEAATLDDEMPLVRAKKRFRELKC